MKVAVIGARGWAGGRHLAAFRKLKADVRFIVETHPDAKAIAAQSGAVAVDDYRHILDEPLDAVSIALPPSEQPEMAVAFLKKGIPVLCEKPLAMNARDAAALTRAVRGIAGAILMPGFLLHFHPVLSRIRDIIRSGELGRVHELRIDGRVQKSEITGWRLDPRMGGASLVNAVHSFDLARWFLGEAQPPVFSEIGNRTFDIPTEDWMDSIFTAGGSRVYIRSAWWPFREDDFMTLDIEGWVLRLRVDGERGSIVLTRDGYLHVRANGTETVAMASTIDLFEREMKYFLDCVQRKVQPDITVEDNEAAQLLVDQTKEGAVRRR
jgi:predicted dehydrogenase